jgi:MFS family permease
MLVSLAAIGVIYFQLNERKKCEAPPQIIDQGNTQKLLAQDHKPCYTVTNENTHNLKAVLAIPNAVLVLIIYFLVFLGFNFFYVAFPVQAVQGLGWSTIEMGLFFSVLSGVMILFQGPILTRLSATYADEPLIIWGGVALALGFACFTSSNLVIIALGTLLFAGGNGIMWPSFLSKMSGLTNSSMQGALQGIASSVGSFASIIGLIAGGVLYGQMGALVFVIPTLIFIAVTLVLLLKKW